MSDQNCGTCRFSTDHRFVASLECRAHPPKAAKSSVNRGIFPLVESGDWCGEWAAYPTDLGTPPEPGDATELARHYLNLSIQAVIAAGGEIRIYPLYAMAARSMALHSAFDPRSGDVILSVGPAA